MQREYDRKTKSIVIDKADWQNFRSEVEMYNLLTLQLICAIGAIVAGILWILSMPIIGILSKSGIYSLLTVFFSIFGVLTYVFLKNIDGIFCLSTIL